MVAGDKQLRDAQSSDPEMTGAPEALREIVVDPDAAARTLVAVDEAGARALAQAIERHLATGSLDQVERVWDLSASQAASLFGISRQAYAKWRIAGIPAERRTDVGEIGAITAMLLAYVKVDRIPAVVRRTAESLDGASIIDAVRRDPRMARNALEQMLDLRRIQP